MPDKMDFHIEKGVGYIKEFNGTLVIGKENKFEPLLEWLTEKSILDIKGIGKRYLPTNYPSIKVDSISKKEMEFFFQYSRTRLKNKFFKIINKLNKLTHIDYYFYDPEDFGLQNQIHVQIENNYDLSPLLKMYENFENVSESKCFEISNFLIDSLRKLLKKIIKDGKTQYANGKYTKCKESHKNLLLLELENLIKTYTPYNIKFNCFSVLLLSGEALIGKTHLFCDITLNRLNNKQPTLLFFGNQFNENKGHDNFSGSFLKISNNIL